MFRRAIVFIFGIAVAAGLVFAQKPEFHVRAKRTDITPAIDGVLEDTVWNNAPEVSGYIQYEPNKGTPASVRTITRILYDDTHIYFGFICFDPEPGKIVLGTSRRDGLAMGTDSVTVLLDTFHDKRTAYYFRTNPRGVQHDGRVSDNGRTADVNWDGIWQSAGNLSEWGWSAEMAIPLTTIKFEKGKNRTWGFQTARYFPRNFEKSFWTGPLDDYRKISELGILSGLDLEQSDNRLQIIPHVLSRIQEREKTGIEAGVDARYDFSSSLSGHLTVNPDFATVEADQEQINLTRFELDLPEKRNFFLEGEDIYQQRIRLFYSRRISDIYGGLKVYGKAGSNEISALTAQTNEVGEEDASANFTVFRLKRDILKSSTLGILAANKAVNGINRGTLGLDTALYFSNTFRVTGQVAMSYGKGNKNDFAFFIRPSYDSSTSHIHLRFSYLGLYFGDYANAVGFIPDDNRHELDSDINKTFWVQKGFLEKISYQSNYNIYWGMDKILRSWRVNQSLSFDLRNKFNFSLQHNQEYKLYEKDFRNHRTRAEIGYNTREWESAALSYESGKNFDSDFSLISGIIRQKLSQSLSAEYSLTRLSLDPDPEKQSTWIHALRVNQYFTKDLFLKVFFQTNSSIDKQNIQIVLVYRFQPPFGLIQLAYQKGTAEFGERGDQGHTLFIKFAYVF
ncbi:MAG: carbohydrate binding family 9 domain-containing protein [Candidatus Aminicenantes bacterium]|nr:carbohydrate binding family 9 domain-containing protein [Candidatus Aminicenantes bacterium]